MFKSLFRQKIKKWVLYAFNTFMVWKPFPKSNARKHLHLVEHDKYYLLWISGSWIKSHCRLLVLTNLAHLLHKKCTAQIVLQFSKTIPPPKKNNVIRLGSFIRSSIFPWSFQSLELFLMSVDWEKRKSPFTSPWFSFLFHSV